MSIDRKFNMLSTKEWIQYLQYKLTPEREKEIEIQSQKDVFLKEALDIIGDKENRALAYQSITYLINVIEGNTGVSESKITKVKSVSTNTNSGSSIQPKLIAIIIAGLILLGMLGYGIYYLIQQNNSTNEESTMVEAQTISESQSYADSSLLPMETLPTPISAMTDTTKVAKLTPKSNVKSSSNTNNSTEIIYRESPVQSASEPKVESNSSKERELFQQAQDQFKNGNRDEAKRILKELKSYENPMKSQAETILKNMEN